ncbi:MAG TPA: hypothetical protein PLQ01_04755 [Methanothrix sp.]|nr:hypothetical protein [Methanothrix sp.]
MNCRGINLSLMRAAVILAFIAIVMPLALSAGDYLTPDTNMKYPPDWLEGGYVRGFDRSMTMDPGIAGMVKWLDAPVTSYPWYSSDVTFYRQTQPATAFTPYTQYYQAAGRGAAAVPDGEIISTPAIFNISQMMPAYVFYGDGQGLPYSQYLSVFPSRACDLWIRGTSNWTQYIASPVGSTIELVANAPTGGAGGVYQTVQTESASVKSKTYHFYQGYNTMSFYASQIGRHMLYYVIGNQPSNVVVIDVFAPTSGGAADQPPSTPSQAAPTTASAQSSSLGDTQLIIYYPGANPFQVYIDGVYVGDGAGGRFTYNVKGGTSHVIAIWDGFWMYQNNVYFESGVPKIINVEAV